MTKKIFDRVEYQGTNRDTETRDSIASECVVVKDSIAPPLTFHGNACTLAMLFYPRKNVPYCNFELLDVPQPGGVEQLPKTSTSNR